MATPWEIGSAHWNQRDLYTTSSSIEDDGYGVGPSFHPAEGSFAYHRDASLEGEHELPRDRLFAAEAWPWDLYRVPKAAPTADEESALGRIVDRVVTALVGRSREAAIADEALAVDVRAALAVQRDVETGDIRVAARDGEVTLSGSVPTELMKHRACAVARDVDGVKRVHDELHVKNDDDGFALLTPLGAFGF
ncbi:MAG TPA: BON domain-containing protein [Labilithrix sp.]|jgi:hypothetical protein